MQLAISYVISSVSKIADVNPHNIKSSLLDGSLCIQDMRLRSDSLNSTLPFPIRSGHINELSVQIPWPTSSKPLVVHVTGVTLTLETNAQNFYTSEMSTDFIRNGITEKNILGTEVKSAASDEDRERHEEDLLLHSESSSVDVENLWTQPEVLNYDEVGLEGEDEDEDYMSCHSECESSVVSHDSLEDMDLLSENNIGIFSFLRTAARDSLLWIMNRPIHIYLRDVVIVIPSDPLSEIRAEVVVREVLLQAEPSQVTPTKRIKVSTVSLNDIKLHVRCATESSEKIVDIESVSMRITSVCNSYGELRRKNTSISLNGENSVILDENALQAVLQFIVSYRALTHLPKYCHPFSNLRHRPSTRWSYAKRCVLAFLQDRRRRYNFNLSHLHFYAEARSTYLRLLDYCHCTQDIAEKKAELADVEHDLRYPDVISFLRLMVQRRYSKVPLPDKKQERLYYHQQEPKGAVVASSIHLDPISVRIRLPAKSNVLISDFSFVSRIEEVNLSVGDVIFESLGTSRSLCGVTDMGPFCSFQRVEKNGIVFNTVRVGELFVAASSSLLLQVILPMAVTLPQIFQEVMQMKCLLPSLPASQPPPRRIQTNSVILSGARFCFDDLLLRLERLSFSSVERSVGGCRIGLLLKEISLQFGTEGFVLQPTQIQMSNTDNITVSLIQVNVSNALWTYLCGARNEWDSVIDSVCNLLLWTKEINASVVKEKPVSVSLGDLNQVACKRKECQRIANSQQITFIGLECHFELLKLQVKLGQLDVSQEITQRNSTFLRVIASSLNIFIDYVESGIFTVNLPNGLVCVTSTSENSVTCMGIQVDTIHSLWKGVSADRILLYASGILVDCCGNLTYCSVESSSFLEAVIFGPIRFLYRKNLSSIPTFTAPFLASSFQISVDLEAVYMNRLVSVDFVDMKDFFDRYTIFIMEEVISVTTYQLFFSGLSDIAAVVRAAPCHIYFTDEDALVCQISMPSKDIVAVSTVLDKFDELLPEIRGASPLTMINICDILAIQISVPLLILEVFHYRFPSIRMSVNLYSMKGKVPMTVQEFWDSSVRVMKENAVEISFSSLTLGVCDVALLKVDGLNYVRGGMTSCGEDGVISSDSEISSNDLLMAVENCVRVEVKNCHISAKATPGISMMRDALELRLQLQFMFYSLYRKRVVTCDCLQNEYHNLDLAGPLFFDSPGKVVVVEDCTFLAGNSDERLQIVVCSGSHVYFRRSRFSPSLLRRIMIEDRSASFVCDDCEELEEDLAHEASSQMQENEKQRNGDNKNNTPLPYRLYVIIHHGSIEVELVLNCMLTFGFSAVNMNFSATARKRAGQLRLKRVKCDFTEDNLQNIVFSRVEFDVDCGLAHKKKKATLNVAVRTGKISIPVTLVNTALSFFKMWDTQRLNTQTSSARSYTPLRIYRDFPFTKWKGLVTTSVIPIEVCLLTGTSLLKLILVNAALWSKREATNDEATIEAQLGVQECSIWDCALQAHVPLLKEPLLLVGACQALDWAKIMCDLSVSPLKLFLSSDHIKCLLSLLMSLLQHEKKNTGCSYAMVLLNQAGVPVTLQDSTEQLVLHDRLSISKNTLLFPHCVRAIGGKNICHFEKFLHSLPDEQNGAELLRTMDVAVLENGDKIIMATRVLEGSLTQHVTFRTVFHIMNQLPCAIKFSSNGGVVVITIPPRTLSCIPQECMNRKDVLMRLVSIDGQYESKEERMTSHTPWDVFSVAEERGDASIGQLKEFTFAAGVAYVDMTYRLRGSVLTMFLTATRPTIHNGTRYTLNLSLFINDALVEDVSIGPNETFVTINHNPFGPQLYYFFECKVQSEVYVASERIDVSAVNPVVGESIVMKHKKFPRRYFFELSIQRHQLGTDGPEVVLTVCPRHMFLIENNSFTDIEIVSESCDSVGTLGDNLLFCTPGINFAYLPFCTPLVLRAGKTKSSVFEVNDHDEGQLIMCTPFDSNEAVGVLHCFLLRTQKSELECFMELLPAVVFVNMDPKRSLFLKHIIRSSEEMDGKEWIYRVVVPPSGTLPHTVLSRYGFTDYFTFAWENNAADSECSTPLKVSFSSKTNWMGFVQCGQTQHTIHVRKENSCSTAVLAVSPPQNPYLTLVNMTPFVYTLVHSMAISSCALPSVMGDEIMLRDNDLATRIRLTHNISVDISDGVTAFVQRHEGVVTVVLSTLPINMAVPKLNRSSPGFIMPSGNEEENRRPWKNTLLRVDTKISEISIILRDDGEQAIHLIVQGSELWFVYYSLKITTQCNLSGLCIQNTYKGKKRYVIKPFSFDMTVRDLEVKNNAICALSTQLNITEMELELSDVLLYQLQELAHHCLPKTTNKKNRLETLSSEAEKYLQLPKNRRILLDSVIIFEVRIIMTYDRSVRPPKDLLFHGSSFAKFIPSLHRATITIPMVKFREISCDSVVEVVTLLRERLLIECLKQIPKLVTSVVFFPSLSPLRGVLTSVGSFIFGSSSSSPDLPGTALI